jgi:hypothetical protein
MPSVFISYSSVDKRFAYRLIIDLLTLGFSVWFDDWELLVGDFLSEGLIRGIESSTWFLLLLSPNSISSPWVKTEIETALALEQRRKGIVVLPLLIAPCEVPPALAGRIHLDFSSYSAALEKLEARLRLAAASETPRDPNQYRLPLILNRGLYLDKTAFEVGLRSLREIAPADFKVKHEQIFAAPDADYEALRNHLLRLIDRYRAEIDDDEGYQLFREANAHVRNLEQTIPVGVALILAWNTEGQPIGTDMATEAAYWFCRIMRNVILFYLRRGIFARRPIAGLTLDPSLNDYGADCVPLISDSDIRQILPLKAAETVTHFDLFDDKGRSTPFCVPSGELGVMGFSRYVGETEPANVAILPHILCMFVLPQMVYQYLRNRRHYFGSLDGLTVGIS